MPVCARCGHDNRENAKFCEQCGAPLDVAAAQGREQRKTVTVLFCDVTGSTTLGETLDPERLRALLAGYFERMKSIVERYGGSVEKFIGDAVMAVFGVPVVHEDDALRALRAAAEMRDALPELGLRGRIGVMTGEVVTGTEERLATGDAVNVAARLESAAAPGEVLVGGSTLALVGTAAEFEPVGPVDLKGKAEPIPAYRLLRVSDALERRHETHFVGRERELALLGQAWERVLAEQRCELVTLVGDAGVGKSRLAAEALAGIDARVVRGRCLPYGAGITYWPVVEVVKQLGVLPADEAAATAITALLGETEATTSAEELAWAFRKTLEHAAGMQPLVVLFDDIQWGEETFLDLVEHVALLSSGAPILVLCLARPELAERRPGWPITFRLEPLADDDVAELMPETIAADLRTKIARAAGGNPLFIGEMLAMAAEADGEVVVPPTLQALLAARLDQLGTAERSVLERGAVEGEVFHRGAVQALAPEDGQVTPRLAALVRKELIRPDNAMLEGDDAFRFRHLLVRDAAYDALPKAVRAALHERFATWLQERGLDLVELDEILGYHLEQAWRYRVELGMPEDGRVAAAARARLAAAGQRAFERDDVGAALTLLERAAAIPSEHLDLSLEKDLVGALVDLGRGDDARRRATVLLERASAHGGVDELGARIIAGHVELSLDSDRTSDDLAELVARSLPVFESAEDDVALYVGYSALMLVAITRAKMDEALVVSDKAFDHAQRARLHRHIGTRAAARFFGTTPTSEVLAWLDEQEERGVRDSYFLRFRACSLAMLGRIDEARAISAQLRTDLADRGSLMNLGTMLGQDCVIVELLAGDPAAAVAFGEEGCRVLEELGEKGYLSTAAGNVAQALCELDRLDEAEAWAARAAELGARDDAITQALWRQARAKVLARRGEREEAARLAREAVAIADETEMPAWQGDAYSDLAEVLLVAGEHEAAAVALEQAADRHARKENLVSLARVQERLAAIRAESPA